MNRSIVKLVSGVMAPAAALFMLFGSSSMALAQSDQARVRAVHASPDGPAVDILVNDDAAFKDVAFKDISDYAGLDAGSVNVKVVPAGETEPAVIDADLDLAAGQDYTVVAVGMLDDIEPLVLTDENGAPAAGKAHVRFVHASPDAPAVDVAVKGGPVLFSGIAFKGVGDYAAVDAASYNLEVRLAGTEDVVLEVPGVNLEAGAVYTVFAVGLAGGDPQLSAVLSVDAKHDVSSASTDDSAKTMPTTLPKTGAQDSLPWLMAAGAAMMVAGLVVRRRAAQNVGARE